ncbi:MAG: P-loop NTPase [Bacteroidetes bacterium]|jgi:MinD superfamily P-loop ATPase|nr:P-loop NTPase [Bacteroidota bacterium]
MAYKIAVASGKGGTGKTSVSVNLYHYLAQQVSEKVQLVDCDVEEPDDILFFKEAQKEHEENFYQLIPEIDTGKCTFCSKCAEYCEFNAIVILPPAGFAEVNKRLCHSCGACLVACPEEAIHEKKEAIGTISCFRTAIGNGIVEGKLKIGSAMQSMLVKAAKKSISQQNDLVIYDAPPGTSCTVVQTVSDVDYVILVTEPTLFGLHDLKIMVDLVQELKKPYGVVINKTGFGCTLIHNYLATENIELLGEIPFLKEYASNYANGELFNHIPHAIENSFQAFITNIDRKILQYEGDNYFKW